MPHHPSPHWLRYLLAVVANILLAYIVYMLCRLVYVAENWSTFAQGWGDLKFSDLLAGSLRFDTAAICYTHIPYILLMLLPFASRHRRAYQMTAKWLFVIVNSLAVVINLCDAVYSQYTGRRTTSTFFREFDNEGNLGSIVGVELVNHWYLVLIGIALIAMLWFLYRTPRTITKQQRVMPRTHHRTPWLSIALQIVLLAAVMTMMVFGMRGGASKAIRPITISNANQYVNNPSQAAIVLNTPFAIIRTIGKTTFTDPAYYSDADLDAIYSPLHYPAAMPDSVATDTAQHNVVVLIVESLAAEYIGALNPYQGYTPFLDSLIGESLTFTQSYANGRKSIDGMPSILSSIPMFVEPFFVTNYSLNRVGGLAAQLKQDGYASAFFHGAENGSMGFQAFARATGFDHYYGRTEYDADSRFGGEADFDGTWAIWDEPFLQYFALSMSDMPQPFVTALFTASSHHPFVVPKSVADSLHTNGHPMYTCIRYADHALRRFFATASKQPWYKNTIFVITADHTNISEQPAYQSEIAHYYVPIIFFDPSGTMPRGRIKGVAQQIDIMPTILGALHHQHPYMAFGKDLLSLASDNSSYHSPTDTLQWAVSYNNGVYQYVQDSLLLLFDGNNSVGLYNLANDPLMKQSLLNGKRIPAQQGQMQQTLKAIVQSYMQRMRDDKLVYGD